MTESLVLELTRADKPSDAYTSDVLLGRQRYLLRRSAGVFKDAELEWGPLLAALAGLQQADLSGEKLQSWGERLRSFLAPAGWDALATEIAAAARAGKSIRITFLSAAAELYALPWELILVEGQRLCQITNCLVRYTWPGAHGPRGPRREQWADGGHLLFVWSAAGGHVPADDHRKALQSACADRSVRFTEVPNARRDAVKAALQEARDRGAAVTMLHVLAHGTLHRGVAALVLGDAGGPPELVDPNGLGLLLGPFAATLRLVVLSTCHGGQAAHPSARLGSLAQALHRGSVELHGIEAVIASRLPFSVEGSIRFAAAFYPALFRDGLEAAFLSARERLDSDRTSGEPCGYDYASLQLYVHTDAARSGAPADAMRTEALGGLRTPHVREQLSQFRALFSSARARITLLDRYKRFHDVLQELEVPFNAIERDRKRLLASPQVREELREPLERAQLLVEQTLRILGEDRLRDEFDMSRRQLTSVAAALSAAIDGDMSKLQAAMFQVRHLLGLDMSSANNRLLATARELGLDAVATALRFILDKLRQNPGRATGIEELARLIANLDDLHRQLEALVREHNDWQQIDNSLRLFVGGRMTLEETLVDWPAVRDSLVAVLAAGNNADWTRSIAAALSSLDGELERKVDSGKCVAALRNLWRWCNRRFFDVDKQLLRTCESLQGVGNTLDSVLKVIDEQ